MKVFDQEFQSQICHFLISGISVSATNFGASDEIGEGKYAIMHMRLDFNNNEIALI